jgi:hypothetical protein
VESHTQCAAYYIAAAYTERPYTQSRTHIRAAHMQWGLIYSGPSSQLGLLYSAPSYQCALISVGSYIVRPHMQWGLIHWALIQCGASYTVRPQCRPAHSEGPYSVARYTQWGVSTQCRPLLSAAGSAQGRSVHRTLSTWGAQVP